MNNTAFHGSITILLLVVHVVTGSVAAIAGFVALFAVKGRTVHRRSGRIFVYSMVVMALLGALLSVVRGSLPAGNIPVGLLTAYLVVSGLTTVRPLSPAVDWTLMGGALVSGITLCAFGVAASRSPNGKLYELPSTPYFAFGAVALLAAVGDARMLRAGGTRAMRGAKRLTRHLWRMCVALGFGSFIGGTRVIPKAIRTLPVEAIPVLLALMMMLYWLWKIRLRKSLPAYGVRRGASG
jgi:uncharacterized membrane protein